MEASANGEGAVKTVAGVFGLFAGLVALVYVFGGIVLLLRLQVRGLRAEVVVSTLPRDFLVSVGLPVIFQLVVFLFLPGVRLRPGSPRANSVLPLPG